MVWKLFEIIASMPHCALQVKDNSLILATAGNYLIFSRLFIWKLFSFDFLISLNDRDTVLPFLSFINPPNFFNYELIKGRYFNMKKDLLFYNITQSISNK